MQLRWHDVCDGARMLRSFLAQLPGSRLPPVPAAERLGPLLHPPPADEDEGAAGAPPAAPASDPSSLASLLASFLPPQLPAAPAASDSSGSEDTCAVAPSPGSGAASQAAASSGSCLAPSESNSQAPRSGLKGLHLPPRRSSGMSRAGSLSGH